ncbi:hypothetical protein R3P38DRAFT_222296 [Favolaschia claudopus]|uniref:Secreted protein n=1 Tax=Favolaschia claudopus TaxID=2862362 RepID=A0AAV9ZT03_9AGAR
MPNSVLCIVSFHFIALGVFSCPPKSLSFSVSSTYKHSQFIVNAKFQFIRNDSAPSVLSTVLHCSRSCDTVFSVFNLGLSSTVSLLGTVSCMLIHTAI